MMGWLDGLNGILWHDAVLYTRLDHPGAVTHFQALSAALSATVGLGNIAGVALAVSLGGPGAVFWMWVTGFIGMALKMTEVTQAMLTETSPPPTIPTAGRCTWCAGA